MALPFYCLDTSVLYRCAVPHQGDSTANFSEQEELQRPWFQCCHPVRTEIKDTSLRPSADSTKVFPYIHHNSQPLSEK